ncbi:hypothetical protein GCM10027020_16930 [Nocardioides salsibiostraticola]
MNSSGIKRGLAATAIGALAVTGLPAFTSSASAESINAEVGPNNVELYSQYSGSASTQNDGENNTVRLLAGGGNNVTQVQFRYNTTKIGAPVTRQNGVFSMEWTPPAAINNTTVVISAEGLTAAGDPVGVPDTMSTTISPGAPAVNIANAAGSVLPIFDQPYGLEDPEANDPANNPPAGQINHDTTQGIVSGTASSAAPVTLSDRSENSPTRPPVTPTDADNNNVFDYTGAVDLQNYLDASGDDSGAPDATPAKGLSTGANAVNEAIIGADNGTDETEVVNLVQQKITTVTAVANPAQVPNGSTSSAVVTVTDANGAPIAGAQVIFDQDKDDVWDDYDNSTPAKAAASDRSAYTNAKGQATFGNLTGTAGGSSYNFFVNTDDEDDYQASKDFKRTVTVTSFAQVATTVTATSKDGNAFDVDENAAGDLQVKVTDQNGAGAPNQTVSYSLSIVPFVAPVPPATTPAPTTGQVTTGANGVANIPFTNKGNGTYTLRTFVEKNGTPGQQEGDLSGADLVFKAGDSSLTFDDAPTVNKISGTTATFGATLKLSDGTPLPGRLVGFTYAPTGNSIVAAQGDQPAGTTRSSATTAQATTGANGGVSVAVTDPASPNAAELNNKLDADTLSNTIGNAAEDAPDLDVDFVRNNPAGDATVVVKTDNIGKPGEATSGTVTVTEDADNNPATAKTPVPDGQAVTVTIEGEAFFTDGRLAGGATGDDAQLDNDGKSKVLVVDGGNGQATFQISVGRDAGFDDDGMAESTVTGKAGTFTGSDEQVFNSANPLNGGEVSLELTPNQNVPTTPARTGDSVAYDVFTTDQFGNRVGNEPVTITDSSATATTSGNATSDFDADGDFTVTDTAEETVTLTASWTQTTTTYSVATPANSAPTATNPATGTETLKDTADQVFFEANFDDFNFEIEQIPDGDVKVGSAVTEVVTVVDENGNPVQGLNVAFIRSGPGDQQDGDANDFDQTNQNGQAFYTFTGTEAGTAQISAVITENAPKTGRTIISDDVTFVGEPGGPVVNQPKTPIAAQVNGQNNGAKNDRVRIKTTPSAGNARVKLFTRAKNGFSGRKVLLKETRLNGNGRKTFVRPDNNGNAITKYWVVVRGTDTTKRDRSNTKKLR